MFENFKKFETDLAGRRLVIETGKISQLSNGSCFVRYGDTVVLVNVTAANKPRDGIDFFPLSVDFEEKLYSVGRIPGSYTKKEGRPTEKAILTSRVIDRPIRPLFPKDMRNDVCVVCTVMSVDQDCSPEIAAMIGTSVALSISDIPWGGPISGVNVGLIDKNIVINPTVEEREKSHLSLTVASTEEKVIMIEAGADEVSEDIMLDAIMSAHKVNKEIIKFIKEIKLKIGKEKFEYESSAPPDDMFEKIFEMSKGDFKVALDTPDKVLRDKNILSVYEKIREELSEVYEEEDKAKIDECLYKTQKLIVRDWLIHEKKRVDGRGIDEIRPLSAEVHILPRVHGSGLFSRGQTQVLTVATLGGISEKQSLDGIDLETEKRYMHHYNFPPYSVGEARPPRAPGRREIGHGALAERALIPVIPSVDEFPYAIRLVSEITSSNGSTSQGSVCASTLALMDAGVPIKSPVAGISCGLITEGDSFITMVDIQGIEDFFGDMDFKVAGTHKGITAIQMDLKIDGLTEEIIKEAFEKTKRARSYIIDEVLLKAIEKPREELSPYAPRTISMVIPVEKIREVIGSGGKVVQKLTADYEVKIDIEEDGHVFIYGTDANKCNQVVEKIKSIIFEPEVGVTYNGKVTRLMEFGAFIEIAPGKEGMCHISKISDKRVAKVSDVLNIGDQVLVKLVNVDEKGRLNFSIKDALR